VPRLFGPKPYEEPARGLYTAIVAQARQPAFFLRCGLPDTVDGRFDLLVLHVFLVMHRLKREGAQTAELSQALFDVFFQDMDESLRELGVGDIGVGRRIKAMAEGFYGRILAYEQALALGGDALEHCIARNLYGAANVDREQVRAVAIYISDQVATLAGQETARLGRGEVVFGPAPAPATASGAGGQRR
jgi:cytochrome b pre-mRNA-processing protein 3